MFGSLGFDVLFKGTNMARILGGLGIALKISLISVAISIAAGIVIGILISLKNPVMDGVFKVYLEIVRIMPQMVLLFIVYFGAAKAMGLNLSPELSSIIVFSFWGIA